MMQLDPLSIERVAIALSMSECPPYLQCHNMPTERALWARVVIGVLSPQVDYDTASAAARALDAEGLLPCRDAHENYERDVAIVLGRPVETRKGKRRYRFPNRGAKLLSRMHVAYHNQHIELSSILQNQQNTRDLRNELMRLICGFGPKQASMFLRDCGFNDDVAIIDRHILRYMHLIRLIDDYPDQLGATKYFQYERIFLDYADYLGIAPGALDWAIWVTMRSARELACA